MRVYDISKELFSAPVYPADPIPEREPLKSIEDGNVSNLTKLMMCSHTGTHLDAPRHFVRDGHGTDTMDLSKCMGPCKVVSAEGSLTAAQIDGFLSDGTKRLLIHGDICVTPEAAEALASNTVELIGVERFTVGDSEHTNEVHQILLSKEIVILEALQLADVPDGQYFLSALPLKMEDMDGSPVRAVLTLLQDIYGLREEQCE